MLATIHLSVMDDMFAYIHTHIHTLIYTSSIIYNWEMNHSINRSIGSHFPIISHCILPYPIRLRRNKQQQKIFRHWWEDETEASTFLIFCGQVVGGVLLQLANALIRGGPVKEDDLLVGGIPFFLYVYIYKCVCVLSMAASVYASLSSVN